MDFSKALEALKEGNKIRLRNMKEGVYIQIQNIHNQEHKIWIFDPVLRRPIEFYFYDEALLSNDWEVIEEKEVQLHPKPILEDAILLAVNAHHGQKDKLGKEYILHPLWVMNHIDGDTLKIIAVLHDVVEDTNISLTDLYEMGYPQKIVGAIDAITKRPGEDRHAYLDRVMSNPLALQVKKVDTLHNTSEERMKCLPDVERNRLSEKYENDAEYMERNRIPEVKLQRCTDTYFECPNCGGYREVIVYSEDISNDNNIKECRRCGKRVRIVNLGEFYTENAHLRGI